MTEDEKDILAGLEFDIDVSKDVNVTVLDSMDLLNLFQAQKNILLDLGEVLSPRTQAGRDAHSLYGACRIELTQRGLM